jgi:periplasmic protein TonB
MKKILFFTIAFFTIQLVSAQENKTESNKAENIYNFAGLETKPEFLGGMQEFYNYIGKNYNTPNVKGLNGKVFVSFVIEKDGSIVEIKILRDLGYGTGKEAERVLKKCPKWSPGEQNGKKVRVLYTLPISINNN